MSQAILHVQLAPNARDELQVSRALLSPNQFLVCASCAQVGGNVLVPARRAALCWRQFRQSAVVFSAITFHYGIAGVLLWMLASYRASQLVPSFAPNFAPLNFYFPVTIGWTLVNVFYLAWYFIGQRDERRVEQILSEFVKEKAQ